MSAYPSDEFTAGFQSNRRELSQRMQSFGKSLDVRLHDDVDVRIGQEGILAAAAVYQSEASVGADALKRGVDVAVVYIDLPRTNIPRGLYRCHVAGTAPKGQMSLFDADGTCVAKFDAEITIKPSSGAAKVCGVGTSSHVDPSGEVPTKTVCWAVVCSDGTTISIVTGCLVNVPP